MTEDAAVVIAVEIRLRNHVADAFPRRVIQ
jgi:hypothetical protein